MKYNNPPKKSKLKFLSKASDFQIVVLCEYFLMSIDPKFKRWDQSTFFNKKKNDWINEEFSDIPFSDRSAFEIDVKKIIPCYKAHIADEYADKNHLHVFSKNLSEDQLSFVEKMKKELYAEWDTKFRKYKGTKTEFKDGNAIDQEVTWEWDESINDYRAK